MSELDARAIVDTAGFHRKCVAVSSKMTEKKELWDNVAKVAHQSMPFYDKAALERHITELQRFLILKALCGDSDATILSPSVLVDEVWHIFILFTRDYAEVCGEALVAAGLNAGLIHHNPLASLPGDEYNKKIRYQNTRALYAEVFGSSIPVDIWPVEYLEGYHSNVTQPNSKKRSLSSSSSSNDVNPETPLALADPEVTLNLSLTEFPDRIAHCKVKQSVQLQKVFDDFMYSLDKSGLSFYLRGQKLGGTATVGSLAWIDSDTIIVKD